MKRNSWLLSLSALIIGAAACAVEKSENPLSPTLAGPIPGVQISAPKPIEPNSGMQIAANAQPLTLLLENASTTGPRPLSYLFEVATDSGFGNKVFERAGIDPGTGGRTSLRLPDALSTRGYYWRAKAEDGANTGPYSTPATFSVYTPIAFDKPTPLAPINNVLASDNVPDFSFTNAPRVGSPGAVSYVVEIARDAAFGNIVAAWTLNETAGSTKFTSPAGLPVNSQLFWHVRAYDASTLGPWSDTSVFRTPAPVVAAPAPAPGIPVPPGGSCSSQPFHIDVVKCRRNQFGHMSPAQLNQFLILVAKDLNAKPFSGGAFGILEKPGGNNCLGYSCDIICSTNGDIWDTLGDSEGSQDPLWGFKGNDKPLTSTSCKVQ